MATRPLIRLPKSIPEDPKQNHICAIFYDQDEEYAALLPYIKNGFRRNDKAFHIVDPGFREEHIRRMARAGIDVKPAEARKQLEVKTWADFSRTDDHFDQWNVPKLIEDALKAGRSEGFQSTRLIAHMEWLLEGQLSLEDFLEYEVRMHAILDRYTDPVVFVYYASKFDAGIVLEILRTHSGVMISGVMQQNPFYISAEKRLEEVRGTHAGARQLEAGALSGRRLARNSIRDLVALSGMSATWIGREPGQVAKDIVGILMAGLQLEAAYMRLKRGDGTEVEVLQPGKWPEFSTWVNSSDVKTKAKVGIPAPRRIELTAGGEILAAVQIPIGMEIEAGSIVVGSDRTNFPTEMESIVLSVAANQGLVSFENSRLLYERERTEAELQILKEDVNHDAMFADIIGSSPVLKAALSSIPKVAPTDSTVLITGETGTGKELVARAIHKRSRRAERPFVGVNCAALAPSLIASELFGHEKGSFTGAVQRRLGRFELANGGTIFLDEVGELPLETQVALLRVLQERVIERVGGSQQVAVNVRVVAATNRDLEAAVAAGTFRADLYYRLNVFPIHVPPLRNRKEDIPALVRHFVAVYAEKNGKKIRTIDRGTMEMLKAYQWPGNVRELQNIVERSLIFCEGETFSVDVAWLTTAPSHHKGGSLLERIIKYETEIVESALKESKGKVSGLTGAAGRLGIPSTTLESRIKALGIDKERFRG